MKIQIAASPTAEISIAPLTTENVPGVDKAKLVTVHPSAFILTNLSNRGILALAVEWVYTTPDGHTAHGFHKSDSFFTKDTGVIVQPHARMFVGPQVFLPESLAFSPHVGAPFEALDGRRSPWSADAAEISVAIDMAVFDDGEIVGQNKSQYDIEIEARKLAARQIVSTIRYAQSHGQDTTSMLETMAQAPVGPGDFLRQWTAFYAQILLKSKAIDAQLTAFEDTPTPPKSYRKTQ